MADDISGNPPDVPWAAVFDPAVNVRALGEIQARGFRAASEVVDKFVRMADRLTADATADPRPDGAADTESRSATGSAAAGLDLDKLVDAWQGMAGQLAGSLRGASTSPAGRAVFNLEHADANGQISLEIADAGTVAAEVWLHNGGGEDLGKVRLRCSPLMAHDGTLLPAEFVRFEPDMVPMPARSSRGVTIQIDVGEDVVPGRYRGTLLVEGHAEVWLPVTLAVISTVP